MTHLANVLATRAGTGYAAAPSELEADPEALERLGLVPARLAALEDTVKERLARALEQFE